MQRMLSHHPLMTVQVPPICMAMHAAVCSSSSNRIACQCVLHIWYLFKTEHELGPRQNGHSTHDELAHALITGGHKEGNDQCLHSMLSMQMSGTDVCSYRSVNKLLYVMIDARNQRMIKFALRHTLWHSIGLNWCLWMLLLNGIMIPVACTEICTSVVEHVQ